MIVSLVAVLMLTTQPAPEEAPVVVETDVEVQAETPVVDAEVQADADADALPPAEAQPPAPAAPPAEAQAEFAAETEAAATDPEEEVICRRRLRPSERIGQRHRVVNDCRTRAEWNSARRRRGASD